MIYLKLLDGLLKLGNNVLLILKSLLSIMDVLVLLLNQVLNIFLVSLKVNDDLLSDLEVTLDLTSLLLHVEATLLLTLMGVFQLVQGHLELLLDFVEVIHLLLGLG